MSNHFFRYEIENRNQLQASPRPTAVVIVDRNEYMARSRLMQMHPWAHVLSVQQTPFELPVKRPAGEGAKIRLYR